MSISPPQYALELLQRLERAGYRAYLVGGCVRDSLLGRRAQDWDVCTNARPEEVLRVFPHAVPTGLKHGTVTVRIQKRHIEVTTFRTEGAYLDHRRPESVCFVSDLREDLQRRDFTMNALAVSLDGEMHDPFGGREDIAAGLIRCVGSPRQRFEEDALRMFRALRFSAQLGFAIERETMQAICEFAPLAKKLAVERVRDELEKMLLSARPGLISDLIGCGLLAACLKRPETALPLQRLASLPRTQTVRWAAFCALLEQSGSIDDTRTFLVRLRMPGDVVSRCSAGVSSIMVELPQNELAWKKLLSRVGEQAANCAAAAAEVLHRFPARAQLRAVLESGECWSLRELAVSGRDLLMLGLQGAEVGAALEKLLAHVLEHPHDNQRDILLKRI